MKMIWRTLFKTFSLLAILATFFVSNVNTVQVKSRSAIPPNIWKELQKINSTADFMKKYLVKKPSQHRPSVVDPGSKNKTNIKTDDDLMSMFDENLFPPDTDHTKPGSALDEAGYEVMAGFLTPAAPGCVPKMTSVSLPRDNAITYFPMCVELPRCGGCCDNDLLECAPTEVFSKSITAMKTELSIAADGTPTFNLLNISVIPMFGHKQCECKCKIQEHHCLHPEHLYDINSCSCICQNQAEASLCTSVQKWDQESCGCVCRQLLVCHETEYFSYTQCQCKNLQGASDPDALSAAASLCSNQNCRAGWAAVAHGEECECEPSHTWDGVKAGSIDVVEWDKLPGGSKFEEVTTVEPATRKPAPTRGSRGRPTRRRVMGGARGRRSIRKEQEGLEWK